MRKNMPGQNGKKPKDKIAEYKAKLKKIEAEEKRVAELPLTDLKSVLAEVTRVEYIEVKGLGRKLPFKRIGIGDFVDIQAEQDKMRITYMMLFHFLKGGDPNVTQDDVAKIPFEIATDWVTQMTEKAPFFRKGLHSVG